MSDGQSQAQEQIDSTANAWRGPGAEGWYAIKWFGAFYLVEVIAVDNGNESVAHFDLYWRQEGHADWNLNWPVDAQGEPLKARKVRR